MEVAEAQNMLHDAIESLGEGIGPDDVASPLLTDWVLISAWVDPDSGESTITRVGSPNLLVHSRAGLLYEGLHGFGGI